MEKYNESPARNAWLEEKKKEESKKEEKRTNFGAISGFTVQGVLEEDEYPEVWIVVEEEKQGLSATVVLERLSDNRSVLKCFLDS